MSIMDFLNNVEDSVELHSGFGLDWSVKGIGFGQFYFHVNENGDLTIDNENMSKTFIKKVLNQMVDEATLSDPKDEPSTTSSEPEDVVDVKEVESDTKSIITGECHGCGCSIEIDEEDVKPDDFSICTKCASYLIIDENMQIREPTVDEIVEMPNQILHALTKARFDILEDKRWKNEIMNQLGLI